MPRCRRRSCRATVLAILIVFGRWVKRIPGGLVAVVGMIAASWIFDFSEHDVSVLGPVPSGLPHIGLPQGMTWHDASIVLPMAASLFIVILAQSAATSRAYAVKYGERFNENTDLVGLGFANLAAGLQQHVRRQRQPDEDGDGRRGQEPHAGRAADDRGRRGGRAAVPHKAAAVPAQRGAVVGGLPDRPQAGRPARACGRSCDCERTSSWSRS